jgi:serine/threonine protein kinase
MPETDTKISGAPLGPGTRLNGIFEIDSHLASGGMGEIYRGHAIETGDPVAIKVMRTDLGDNAMALALFRKEASALHNIHHEAIIRYYLFSHDPATQRHYLAMEFVDGQPLSNLLRSGPLSFAAVRKLQQRLAEGLEAAHVHDIIHRDLTPDNVLVPDGDVGRAKIIDFGIARITRAGESTIIGTGFAGKYNYVSPEQLGLLGGKVTAKSDIYSLGLVLAECLTGYALDMGGSQLGVMAIDRRRTVPDLGAIDPRYRPLLSRMLQPDPADRPNSMAEIAHWEAQSAPPPARARPTTTKPRARARDADTKPPVREDARKRSPLRPVTYAAVGFVMLLGIGVIGFHLMLPGIDENPVKPSSGPVLNPRDGNSVPTITADEDEARRRAAEATRQRINDFINAYDGGNCFYVTPPQIEEKKAVVDGLFGISQAPFDTLADNFERDIGLELEIDLHGVTRGQCPAVNFLWQMRNQLGPAPRLEISSDTLARGSEMSGRVAEIGNRNVDLLLMADDGDVWSLNYLLRPDGNAKSFSFTPQRNPGSQPQQLLIAVVADKPLDTLKLTKPGNAAALFPKLLAEAQRSGQTLNVGFKYFKVN